MHHAFACSYTWMGARADEHVVFGPRFAIYSAVVQLPDGARPALDVSASLREDANVIDRLCRLALGTYDDWRRAPDAAAVPVDGEPARRRDGTFDGREPHRSRRATRTRTRPAITRRATAPVLDDRRLA